MGSSEGSRPSIPPSSSTRSPFTILSVAPNCVAKLMGVKNSSPVSSSTSYTSIKKFSASDEALASLRKIKNSESSSSLTVTLLPSGNVYPYNEELSSVPLIAFAVNSRFLTSICGMLITEAPVSMSGSELSRDPCSIYAFHAGWYSVLFAEVPMGGKVFRLF